MLRLRIAVACVVAATVARVVPDLGGVARPHGPPSALAAALRALAFLFRVKAYWRLLAKAGSVDASSS